MPLGNLPDAAKKIWEEVHTKAKSSSTCKDSPDVEACAAKVAWTAVHNAGWKKDANGEWHKSEVLSEFSLRIDRASYDKATNERRVRAAASDTDEDNRKDSMSLELFNDFIDRIKKNEPVPEEFQSEFWRGGEPYFSVSHYPDGNGKTVPGIIDATYIDGKFLKSKGKFFDTPLGRKCFEAVCADLYGVKSSADNKVRISIAFLDYKHQHKSNGYVFDRLANPDSFCPECFLEMIKGEAQGKIFLKGHLIHEALTRVPVNTRTSMEVDKSMAEKSITRKDDAASIVGDELADELEELAEKTVDKSEALVIRSDEEVDKGMPVQAQVPSDPDENIGNQGKEIDEPMTNDEVLCPNCSSEVIPTPENTCPVCGAPLKQGQPMSDSEVTKEAELVEEATKTEGGTSYPSSDYLVVEKPDEPSTWHLQVKKHGKPDHGLMGGAKAALTSPGGHRGNKYGGPNKAQAISKLKALYSKEKMDWNTKSEAEIESDELYIKSLITETVKSVMKESIMTDAPVLPTPVISTPLPPPVEIAHPLDALFTEFKSKFDEAVKTDLSETEKLQMIQEPFNALGTEIISVVKSSVKPVVVSPAVQAQSDLVAALSQVMNPIGQKLDLLIAQSTTPAIERKVPLIPIRRSIPAEVAAKAITQPSQNVVKSQTPKLRALIEKST